MKGYVHLTAKKDKNEIEKTILNYGLSPKDFIFDDSVLQKNPGDVYDLMKYSLDIGETLVLDSLSSLGKNGKEIYKELCSLKEKKANLVILDIPSSKNNKITTIDILKDCYSNIAAEEVRKQKERQSIGIENAKKYKQLGRKKIPYPENWFVDYNLWKSGQISVMEFMARSSLKKGTFYNLCKQTKQTLQKEKQQKTS